jgi:3-oxoacyl-[acyl-carrier protein] reductase
MSFISSSGEEDPQGTSYRQIDMNLALTGKKALVGGGSRGLGLASARALLEEGCSVAIVSRSSEHLEDACRILGHDGRVKPICADLSTAEGVRRCIQEVDTWGDVDILINNTGGPKPGGALDHDESAWRQSHEAIFLYVQRMVEHFVPPMRQRRWGRVIVITSIVAREPSTTLALSSVYRAAIHSYLKILAKQVALDGVTVNAVMPGSFRTERTDALIEKRATETNRSPAQVLEERLASLPQRRFQQPEELGNLVAFLSSDRAAAITGAAIPIDGGMSVGY